MTVRGERKTTLLPYGAPPDSDWIMGTDKTEFSKRVGRIDLTTQRGQKAHLIVQAVSKFIWRLTFLPPGIKLPAPSPMIAHSHLQGPPLRCAKIWRGFRISASELSLALEIDRTPFAFRFIDRRGRAVLAANSDDVDGLGRPFALPFGFAGTEKGVSWVAASFHLAPEEHIYGLGEKFSRLDKVYQRIIGWTVDALGSTSERSHKNVPFLLSTAGYGLFDDSGARATWDIGTESCRSMTVKVEDSALDLYVIAGPKPADILRRYADLTGHAPVPPSWSFGLWLSSGGTYRTQKEIEKLIAGIDKHRLPADVIHIDPWWMRWRRYCDFRWNRETFPDPEALIRRIHAAGLKVCLWEHPYISVESDLFAFGEKRGCFLRREDGRVCVIDYGLSLAPRPDGVIRRATPNSSWNEPVAILDFTNAEATAWYKDLHRPLLRMGVDVFKTDFGEDVPAEAVFSNGTTGAVMHNIYPLLYNRAVFEVTQEEKGLGLVWSRSGTAGSQRYPVCWSGDPAADWDSLAATLRGGLSAAMSGIPFWSHDIGGYRGKPSPELYVRWAQFGLLCSHSRMHGDSPREPWIFGAEALRIVRRYVRLRYRLFPYIYSLAYEANRTGMPVIRPLPLQFPDDPAAYSRDLEFMLGPWLLVAPIYNRQGERWIYLPTGRGKKERHSAAGDEWIDFWTGRRYPGGRSVYVKAPLARLPLFVRAGAIIPTMEPARRIPSGRIDPLIVEVWPGADSKFTFYEDGGKTDFRLTMKNGRAVLSWNGIRRGFSTSRTASSSSRSRSSRRIAVKIGG